MVLDISDPDLGLGKDFLTWLWYKCDNFPACFVDSAGMPISISMDKRVTIENGDRENRETSIVSGDCSPLEDARFGLLYGKKVTSAIIRLEKDSLDFQFTIRARDFSISSLKLPKIDKTAGEDADAYVLERIFLLESCMGAFDSIYKTFLNLRLSQAWDAELAAIKSWMKKIR